MIYAVMNSVWISIMLIEQGSVVQPQKWWDFSTEFAPFWEGPAPQLLEQGQALASNLDWRSFAAANQG